MDFDLPTTAGALGKFFDAEVIGDDSAVISALVSLDRVSEGSLSYLADRKLFAKLGSSFGQGTEKTSATSKRGVILTRADFADPGLPFTFVIVENPQQIFAKIAQKFSVKAAPSGLHPGAFIDPSAELGESVSVGAGAVISAGAKIGAFSTVGARAYVGPQVTIGEHCQIFPNVTILDRTVIGNRVRILSGSVVGSDGFGIIPQDGGYAEMPQIGNVEIDDDVRVGALCTIDRATLGSTRIGAGTKLDDHVHVGHNCTIGKNVLLCAQVGLGGSSVLRDRVVLGGQVGVSDHVVISEGVSMGAQSGTSVNLTEAQLYFGSPAVPMKEALRIVRLQRQLPATEKRIRELESAIRRLES